LFDRIRLRSGAALAVSLTMVGVGIHGLAQDGGDGGDGTTNNLASSAGSHTPTASPDAGAATRSPAFAAPPAAAGDPDAPAAVEDPAASADQERDPDAGHEPPPGFAAPPLRVRPPAPIATPTVTHEAGTERPPMVNPPTAACLGFVHNSSESHVAIGAEMWTTETPVRVELDSSFVGTAAREPVGGFHIGDDSLNDDYHVTIDYFEIGGGYLETHELDVTEPRRFDVYPCHEAYLTATAIPDPGGQG
jgi:hypothetical protein